jgi:hypothetical protein
MRLLPASYSATFEPFLFFLRCMTAKKTTTQYSFSAPIIALSIQFKQYGVIVPEDIVALLPPGSRIRTKGTMHGVKFALAIQNLSTGEKYFTTSKPMLKQAGLKEGRYAHFIFELSDPEELEMPAEMEEVLAQDDEAKVIWESYTTGEKRSLLHFISSAKSTDTRIKRAIELCHKMKTNTLYNSSRRKFTD